MVRDIPQQELNAARYEQLEAELRRRQHELDEAQRIAHLGTWRWHVPSDTVEWSRETYIIFEQDPALPPPRYGEIEKLHTPESWTLLYPAVKRAMAYGEPYDLDLEIKLPSGATKWVIAKGEVATWVDGKAGGEVLELRGTVRDITSRKLQEQKLARSEARYRSLVRASSEIVWTANSEGQQVDEIPEWAAFTGQTPAETLGFGWADAIHPEDRERTVAIWQRAIRTGQTFEVVQRLRRHDGVYRTMSVRAVPSRDALGNILEWVGMHVDITEQVDAEKALRDSESRFQKLFQAGLIGICFPDKFGAFHDGNDEFLRIVGYTRQDLQAGRVRWDTMTPPEYADLDARHIAQAAQHGSCTPYEKEYVRKDGKRIPILCGYALLEGSQNDYIGFIMDLSAQKQAEEQLRLREQRFRELADSVPQLVWETAPDGTPLFRNRRFEEYFGVPKDQMLGDKWPEYVHPEDRAASIASYAHALQTGAPYNMEYRLLRQDGAYRYFLGRAVPVRDSQGKIIRWIGTATDIHDQKMSEEALRRSEKLATAGRLAASIAHEINNPLGAVTNLLYLVLKDPALSESSQGYLKLAETELARVAHVTTQTLRFHRQSTVAAPAELGQIMDSAFGLFASRFQFKGIHVLREYDTTDPILCCGDELRQVFANLISNALDAIPDNGRLRIRIRKTVSPSTGKPGMRVVLADTGQGIPRELQRRIFEPFLTTKQHTGTGLGLWVTQGIVSKHKGTIRLRSRAGEQQHGTVFSLFFPMDGLVPEEPVCSD
jgi:PAS domain S-box-containing protein